MGEAPSIELRGGFEHEREIKATLMSWEGAFSYVQEDVAQGIRGLRPPQIGAVHMVHGHWSVRDAPGTKVMPTGRGKTETMLSILVSARCLRLLVIVPTDALRTQIANKFLSLGIVKEAGCGVLAATARRPLVGVLQHIPRTEAEVDEIFTRCHVIVTTSSVAGKSTPAVQERMAHYCPHLFIDEAHHAETPTWSGHWKWLSESLFVAESLNLPHKGGDGFDQLRVVQRLSTAEGRKDAVLQEQLQPESWWTSKARPARLS